MKRTILLLAILFIAIGNSWSQISFDIKGKWSLGKIITMDTIIISEGRFFTFYQNNYEFGKINRTLISQGNYFIDKSNYITINPNRDFSIKGTYLIVIDNSESISLKNDSITLFLTRYYRPVDFVQNPEESKTEELKGWNLFKNEQFDIALKHFNNSYLKDSTNYDAIIGLIYSKGAVEGKIDLNLIDIVVKNTEATSMEIGLATAAFVNKYSPKSEGDYKNEDLEPIIIAAFYTGGPFIVKYQNGNPKEKGEYLNKKQIGKWINYRNDGTILLTTEYSEKENIKTYTFHKPDGEIAVKEIEKVNGNTETTITRFIYYQELPDKKGTYLFVSKTGFCVFDQNKKIKFDSSTPDNIIEEVPDLKNGSVWYIWKDGKRTIYQ